MRSDHPGDSRSVDKYGRGHGRGDGDGYGRRGGYGQPATDLELLRQFGRAYDEHVRITRPLVAPREARSPREPRALEPLWALLGLVALVLLLAAAIVVGSLLMGPR